MAIASRIGRQDGRYRPGGGGPRFSPSKVSEMKLWFSLISFRPRVTVIRTPRCWSAASPEALARFGIWSYEQEEYLEADVGCCAGIAFGIERNRDGRRQPGGSDGLRQPGVRICDANRPLAGWRRSYRRQQTAPVGFPARPYPATGESSTRDSRPRTTSCAGTARLH